MTDNNSAPNFSDEMLLAYLDEEVEPETAAQIEASPADRQRAQELYQLQNSLTSRMYRFNCPDPEALGEFHMGMLANSQVRSVERHLEDCPHCARELAELAEFLHEEAEPVVSPLEGLRVLVARLVSGFSGGPGLPAPAFALRGEGETTRVYDAGEAQLVLDVQEDNNYPGNKVLVGLITGMDAAGFQVEVRRGKEQVALATIDELGNFLIENLTPGGYSLTVQAQEVAIYIPAMQI